MSTVNGWHGGETTGLVYDHDRPDFFMDGIPIRWMTRDEAARYFGVDVADTAPIAVPPLQAEPLNRLPPAHPNRMPWYRHGQRW